MPLGKGALPLFQEVPQTAQSSSFVFLDLRDKPPNTSAIRMSVLYADEVLLLQSHMFRPTDVDEPCQRQRLRQSIVNP